MIVEDIREATYVMMANIYLNIYTLENIVAGRISPQEKIPLELYLEDLGLNEYKEAIRYNIAGVIIDDNACVREETIEKFCMEYFSIYMNLILEDAQNGINDFISDNGLLDFDTDLLIYIDELFEIFCRIVINQKPTISFLPQAILKEERCNNKMTNRINCDICIDNYLEISEIALETISQIIEEKNGKIYLKKKGSETIDYKLTVLSLFKFYDINNKRKYLSLIENWRKKIYL